MAWEPDYLSLTEVKQYVRVPDTVDDAELQLALTTASRAINGHCNRQFGQVDAPEERRYTARWDYERCRWVVDIDDLQDATGLVVEVDGTAITAYTLEPVNAVVKGRAWTLLVVDPDAEAIPTGADHEISSTALWGWTAVLEQVKLATALQANRLASRRNSPYGVAGSPEAGSELRLLARVDPDVAVSLRGLVRSRKVG